MNPQESQMNREFNPTSTSIRSVFAAAAVLATLLVAGSIDGLVDHYSADGQVAGNQPVVVAQR
jgi:hypothetical protein